MSVVVAVDESGGCRTAIRLAASEASWRQAQLVAVTAYRSDRTAGVPGGRPLSTLRTLDDDRAAAELALSDVVADAIGDQAAEADLRVVPGLAGRAIIDAARDVRADLIVLAARSGISMLPGTVSQYVLRNARCPVLVVPSGAAS
jgi:nucleotide-binding universal stress UspA family protein